MSTSTNILIEHFKIINAHQFAEIFLQSPYQYDSLVHEDIQNSMFKFVFREIDVDMAISKKGKFQTYHPSNIIDAWCHFLLYLRDNYPEQYTPLHNKLVREMSTKAQFLDLFGLVALKMKMYYPSDTFSLPDAMFNKHFNSIKDVKHLQSILKKEDCEVINISLKLMEMTDVHFELLTFLTTYKNSHILNKEDELFL